MKRIVKNIIVASICVVIAVTSVMLVGYCLQHNQNNIEFVGVVNNKTLYVQRGVVNIFYYYNDITKLYTITDKTEIAKDLNRDLKDLNRDLKFDNINLAKSLGILGSLNSF